jgi:2-oxoglutarate ferredoxin oxidoreductase subunit alpha
MIEMTARAFDLADIYQLPVIVLSDMLLSESHATVSYPKVKKFMEEHKPKRGKLLTKADSSYKRYALSDDGISPRLVPGQEGVYYQVNSYEHLEDGHTTESDVVRIQQVEKRAKKWSTYLQNDFQLPMIYGDLKAAQTIFVGWGSTKGVALETIKQAKTQGKEIAYIHFSSPYPLRVQKITELFSQILEKCVLVENNATSQFGKLLRMETGVFIEKKIVRFDGRPLVVDQLLKTI